MNSRQIVVPGDLLDDSGELKAGANTYKEGERIYALRLGLRHVERGQVDVVALSGRYDPQRNDLVIGTVAEVGPSNWYLDVNAPTQVGMHVNEVPWRVDFGETAKFLNIGDTVLLKVYHVDEVKKAQVTMKDRSCRKLSGGVTITVQPSKVARIVGRNASMLETIKERTRCRVAAGHNGVIWLDGEPEDVSRAVAAIRLIEEQAHTSGFADRVAEFLGGGPIDENRFAPSDDESPEGGTESPPPEAPEGDPAPYRQERREPPPAREPYREEGRPLREARGERPASGREREQRGGRGFGGERRPEGGGSYFEREERRGPRGPPTSGHGAGEERPREEFRSPEPRGTISDADRERGYRDESEADRGDYPPAGAGGGSGGYRAPERGGSREGDRGGYRAGEGGGERREGPPREGGGRRRRRGRRGGGGGGRRSD